MYFLVSCLMWDKPWSQQWKAARNPHGLLGAPLPHQVRSLPIALHVYSAHSRPRAFAHAAPTSLLSKGPSEGNHNFLDKI